MSKRLSACLLIIAALVGISRAIITAQDLPETGKPSEAAKPPALPIASETVPTKVDSPKTDDKRAFIDRAVPPDEIKLFSLANANAEECMPLIKLVAPKVKCQADSRTNTFLAVGQNDDLAVVEAVLLRLDEQPTPRKGPPVADPFRLGDPVVDASPAKEPPRQSLFAAAALGLFVKPQSKALLDELAKLESDANTQAERIRAIMKGPADGQKDVAKLRRNLEQTIAEALRVKLQLEQQQVEALEERLTQVKAQMSKRVAATNEIIERRARELIDDDRSRWNTNDPNLDPRRVDRANPGTKPTPESQSVAAPAPITNDALLGRPSLDPNHLPPPRPSASNDLGGNSPLTSESGSESFRLGSQLFTAQKDMNDLQDQLERARAAKDEQYVVRLSNRLASAQKRVDIANAELNAARQDLELQYEAAQAAVKTGQARLDRLRQFKPGTVSILDMDKSEEEFQREKLLQDRLKVRLDLFNKLGRDTTNPTNAELAPVTNDGANPKPTKQPGQKHDSDSKPATDDVVAPKQTNKSNNTSPYPGNSDWPVPIRNKTVEIPIALKRVGKLGETLAVSNDPLAIRRAISEIAQQVEISNAEEAAMAMLVWADRFSVEQMKVGNQGSFITSVAPAMKKIDSATRAKVFLKQLREGGITVQWTVINCLSPIREFGATDDFDAVCEEVWKFTSSQNTTLRSAALRVLLETAPITREGAPEFNSAELRQMVRRMSSAIPVDRVMQSLKSAMSDPDVDFVLDVALLIATHQDMVPDPHVKSRSISVLAEIGEGHWNQVPVKSAQRYKAVKGLARYRSDWKEVVPILIAMLKSEKTTYDSVGNSVGQFSKDTIVEALEQFGPNAKDALPLIEDEFILIVGRSPESSELKEATVAAPNANPSNKDRLLRAIRSIKAPPTQSASF